MHKRTIRIDRVSPEVRRKLQQVTAQLEQRRPAANHTHAIEFSRLQESFFRQQRANWPRFDQLSRKGSEIIPQFDTLLTDLYFSLYLHEARLRSRESMNAAYQLNHDVFRQAINLPIWNDARQKTVLKANLTKICLPFVAEGLLNTLDEEAKKQAQEDFKREQLIDSLLDQVKQLAEQMNQQEPEAKPDDGTDDEFDGPDEQDLLDEQDSEDEANPGNNVPEQMFPGQGALPPDEEFEDDEAAEELIAELLQAMEQEPPEFDPDTARRAIKRGLEMGDEQASEIETTVSSWGSDMGEMENIPFDQAMQLYEKMRGLPRLKEFTIELGRMENEAYEARKQPNAKEAQEIVDIAVGRGVADALPSERVLLTDPDLEMVFWAKYAQDGVLLWSYAGREQASRGPFIVLLDVSGSTMGTRERWGKAFTIAACDMAGKQGRPTGVVMFDNGVRADGVFSFANSPSLQEKIAMASYWSGGGTSFEEPLEIALSNIIEDKGSWEKADIVLVTDGCCDVDDKWAEDYRQRREQAGVRVHGVLMDGDGGWLDAMSKVCDRAVRIDSFSGSEAAKPLFNQLACW